jgi:chromosome partitioning protein
LAKKFQKKNNFQQLCVIWRGVREKIPTLPDIQEITKREAFMAIVVSLLNHKGGVGKTTSAVNLSAALANLGERVLLIDLDPQANLTLSLGIGRQPVTIYENIRGEAEINPVPVSDNLDVIPSVLDLSGAEMELISEAGRELILRELLAPAMHEYSYIIIDCPPSLGLLTLNALTASDYVLIPLQAQFLAMQGLTRIKQVIDKVRFRMNRGLMIGGVFATMYDSRKVLNREVVETIHKYFGDRVFTTMIRENITLAEAPARKMDIFSYKPESSGAEDYLDLAREMMARLRVLDQEKLQKEEERMRRQHGVRE